ncbi:MAG: 50S ribosomal protein L22 [Oscillospiraceae bacterium]|nr:50S ribosomal protein L22 [Oscillospiraceae bacterium]
MEARAELNYIRIAPRKVQIVLDLIRGKKANEAMAILKHTPKAASEPLVKLLGSAIANGVNDEKKGMDQENMYVALATVSQGPTLKRMRPRAHGRAFRINKKTSHITLVLREAE